MCKNAIIPLLKKKDRFWLNISKEITNRLETKLKQEIRNA